MLIKTVTMLQLPCPGAVCLFI